MIWKKKSVTYTCVAPNYFDVLIDEDGHNNDDYKEHLADAYKNQFFTKEEIDEASKLISFDLWNALIWADGEDWKNDRYRNPKFEKYLRLNFFFADVPKETISKILDTINYTSFYKPSDLVEISKNIDINLMKFCVWQEYVKTTFEQKKKKETLSLYLKMLV